MTRVIVHRPGLLTTIQDRGRWGHQAFGVPVAGPMDGWSHRLANALVGNPRNAATLEVTGTGPDLTFESPAEVAITGARFRGNLDGGTWTSPIVLRARAGSRLGFGERLRGMRAYLAVGGGFDAPIVMGSRATDVRSRIGGYQGRALRTGDTLSTCRIVTARGRGVPDAAGDWILPDPICRLRIVSGPEPGEQARAGLERLLSGVFTVAPRSDRMGYHLTGHSVVVAAADCLSAPVVTGLIQAPPSGEPVLLMADRQTTGGYFPLAVVIGADLPRAGQLGPGDRVAFAVCDPARALRDLIDRERVLLAMEPT